MVTASPAPFVPPNPQGFGLNTVLQDGWDLGLKTLSKWLDHEIPGAELALEYEQQASQGQTAAAQAPQGPDLQGLLSSPIALWVLGGGGALLVLLLLLRR